MAFVAPRLTVGGLGRLSRKGVMSKCEECPDGYECVVHSHVPLATQPCRHSWMNDMTYADYVGMFLKFRTRPEGKTVEKEACDDHPKCPEGLEGSGWDKAMRAIHKATQRPADDEFISVYADREVFQHVYGLLKAQDQERCRCGGEREKVRSEQGSYFHCYSYDFSSESKAPGRLAYLLEEYRGRLGRHLEINDVKDHAWCVLHAAYANVVKNLEWAVADGGRHA